MAENGAKQLQIGNDMFDDEGLLAGLGRKLIKRIKTGSRFRKNSSNQLNTALMAKNSDDGQNSSSVQNGSKQLRNRNDNGGRGSRGDLMLFPWRMQKLNFFLENLLKKNLLKLDRFA